MGEARRAGLAARRLAAGLVVRQMGPARTKSKTRARLDFFLRAETPSAARSAAIAVTSSANATASAGAIPSAMYRFFRRTPSRRLGGVGRLYKAPRAVRHEGVAVGIGR
jgi:hypothetical protein